MPLPGRFGRAVLLHALIETCPGRLPYVCPHRPLNLRHGQ